MDPAGEDVTVEDEVPEGSYEHPKQLVNETPISLLNIFYIGSWALQTYGWFILFGVIFLYVLYKRIQPRIASALRQHGNEPTNLHRYDMDEAYRRQEAMDAARRRMQEKFDQEAAKFAEEQKRKEEEKRKAKLEDWERHQQGKGYKSKYRPPTEDSLSSSSVSSSSEQKPKKKPTYRPSDYNPLTGEGGGSCSYRPSPRGGGASGGG